MSGLRRFVTLAVLAVAFVLLGAQGTSAHALTGAIWTSEANGEVVDGNIYQDKNDVYLNGGPIHEGAAGLPPSTLGDSSTYYVFQVTNPSGSVLLSQDKAKCRVFTVGANGRINGVVDSTTFNNGGNCAHPTGTDVDTGATTIKLMPYANTPNPGGEYKAWITRLGDFADACGADITSALNLNPNGSNGLSSCSGSFGFVGGHTKTDNYKVREVRFGSIAGLKYYDANNNGDRDIGELGIEGWPIKICRISKTGGGPVGSVAVGACAETFTSALGIFGFVGLGAGEYRLREALARDMDSDPANPLFNSFDWEQTEPTAPATSTVYATNAIDVSGTFDRDDMNGVHVVVISENDVTGIEFGNVAFELRPVDGGLTWGYWKTHTGTGETPSNAPVDPVYLGPLGIDLGSTSGTHLDVDTPQDADTVFAADGSGADEPPWPSPQEISDLCSGGDCRTAEFAHPADCEGDCHEQLVAQLLALELNVLSGEFSGDAVYINPGDPNSGMTVNQIIAAADAALSAWFDGGAFDFHLLHATVNAINENASSGVLFALVPLPSPPSPLCFVGFVCL